MTKVSVIVPVFNPGERIEPLLRSLLGQSLPAGEYELIFVDDGSTDGTGERLEALAAERDHVRTIRIPNSGWPGRPRNVGLDAAQGEFVYFVDHDDYLGTEALERLYATAIADEADIVIGKVVGHRKSVPRSLFRENVHELGLRAAPFNLLTPHKLFRRALLDEHGIRFPEGKRRLEDHMFVVPPTSRRRTWRSSPTTRVTTGSTGTRARTPRSRRPTRPSTSTTSAACSTWSTRTRSRASSATPSTAAGTAASCSAGSARNAFLGRDEEHRRGVLAAVRELIEERFPERLDADLAPAQRLRATLARRDDYDGLVALAEYERGLRSIARVRRVRGDGTWMTLETECWLRERGGEPLRVRRRDGRLLLVLPDAVAEPLRRGRARRQRGARGRDPGPARCSSRRATRPTGSSPSRRRPTCPRRPTASPSACRHRRGADRADDRRRRPAPLAPGDYDLRAVVWLAGFNAHSFTQYRGDAFKLTVTPQERIFVAGQVPVPPERTPREQLRFGLGRLRLRARGPRAQA